MAPKKRKNAKRAAKAPAAKKAKKAAKKSSFEKSFDRCARNPFKASQSDGVDWSDESERGSDADVASISGSSSGSDNASEIIDSEDDFALSDASDDYDPREDQANPDDMILTDSDNDGSNSPTSSQSEDEASASGDSSGDDESSASGESSSEEDSEDETEKEKLNLKKGPKKVTYENFVAYSDESDQDADDENENDEVQAAVKRTLAFAAEQVTGKKVNLNLKNRVATPAAKKRVRYEDSDDEDYVPTHEELAVAAVAAKRRAARPKRASAAAVKAIADYSSDEDDYKACLKIERELEKNKKLEEQERKRASAERKKQAKINKKLKKQMAAKKKKAGKKNKKLKKSKKQQDSSDDEKYDFDEEVEESSGSEYEY